MGPNTQFTTGYKTPNQYLVLRELGFRCQSLPVLPVRASGGVGYQRGLREDQTRGEKGVKGAACGVQGRYLGNGWLQNGVDTIID